MKCILTISGMLVFVAVVCIGQQENVLQHSSTNPSEGVKALPLQHWETGIWWTTESHVLMLHNPTGSGIGEWTDHVFRHRWVVAAKMQYKGAAAWVVEVRPERVPASVRDDSGGLPLYTMTVSQETGDIMRIEARVRSGEYHVSGPTVRSYEANYPSPQPVVANWIPSFVPLDAPVWSTSAPNHGKSTRRQVKDERTGKDVLQVCQEYHAGNERVVRHSISGEQIGVRTMTWDRDCPWWVEWRSILADGSIADLWYAQTVDWKGKGAKDGAATKARPQP